MSVTISVKGLAEIERKLNASVLLDPALEEARDTIVKRIMRPPGRRAGAGMRNNTLSADVRELGATIVSTLNNPRQTGSSWQSKNFGIVKSMGPNVIRKAIQRIESRWSD